MISNVIADGINGTPKIPGDKSISHRSLMISALSQGVSRISNLSKGNDLISTVNCLKACGVKIKYHHEDVVVYGGKFSNPDSVLDCGNSGTTVRLLMGLLIGQGISATFTGDRSLLKRPMFRIIKPLELMGAKIEHNDGRLPIKINSKKLKGIQYSSSIASAQIKSSIILAGLGSKGTTAYTEPIKSRDHTEIMLKNLGSNISTQGLMTTLKPLTKPLKSMQIKIPGDPSSAAFFAGAVALIPDSKITINNLLNNPTRNAFFLVLKEMGLGINYINEKINDGENVADLEVYFRKINSAKILEQNIPNIIDEIPILAILATQAEGRTVIKGAKELRYKECDRIHAICSNLKKMNANILELDDGFIIEGPSKLIGARVVTYGDHRIAMAFSIAGLISKEPVILDNQDCVSISFPNFFQKLKEIAK